MLAILPNSTAWTDVTFASGNFTASGSMTWTLTAPDQVTYAYHEVGKTMFLAVVLATTTVGGTPSTALRVAIPNGRTAATLHSGNLIGLNNSAQFNGVWQVGAGASYIELYVDATFGTNWTAATNTTQIRFNVFFEVA